MTDASQTIRRVMSALDGVNELPHRFGGVAFRRGRRELGHLHGNTLLDIPFPMAVRDELVTAGHVKPHHILPESGWISFQIRTAEDVEKAVALLQRSYAIAVESRKRRDTIGPGNV